MKILFLCHYFPPEVNAPASRTYENAKRWIEMGHDVTVITCAPNCPRGEVYPGYRNRLRQVEWKDGIKVVRVWTFVAANQGTWRRILNYLSYMFSAVLAGFAEPRPDVMVATSPQFFCGWAGVILKALRGWRFVLEIRDIWPESITTVGALSKGSVFRLLEAMERRMYAAADHIVTVGKGYRDQLLAKGVDGRRISVVYNGVELGTFSPQPKDKEFIKAFGLEGFRICGYVGTVGMAHGLEILLEAAAQAKAAGLPWKFLIVGDGARLDSMRGESAARGLDGHLVFTGRLDKSRMPAAWSVLDACLIHLKKSDLFQTVIPSKMFEAMGMGIPILMGVEGEALELVLEARAGKGVEPGNPESLMRGCRAIFSEGGEAFALAGRDFVTRNFDRRKLADDYLRILGEKGGTPIPEPALAHASGPGSYL